MAAQQSELIDDRSRDDEYYPTDGLVKLSGGNSLTVSGVAQRDAPARSTWAGSSSPVVASF
jgi:hypothetical protein